MFLASLSAAYAVAGHTCATGDHWLMQVAPAITTVVALVGVALSGWTVLRLHSRSTAHASAPYRFLAEVSFAVAALFLLAIVLQWYVTTALSPCLQ
jgi:hypothetical protein